MKGAVLIMKKTLFAWLLAALCFACTETQAVAGEEISAKAAIVYEPLGGTVLYEKSADEPMLVASTTKIMTALVVLESCGLEEKVDIKPEHTAVEGSSMYLKSGGDYTVRELLYGLLLVSGNDAAAALADHAGGSMEAFAEMMNGRCRSMGLENTHFANSHGLDAENHHSSARDLALITAEAMKNEIFREIFACSHINIGGVDYYNHNKLLSSCPGCTGGKTGYTEKAGRILVSCVRREGVELICVTISDPRDWEDHKNLYDFCFESYDFISLPEMELDVVSGEKATAVLSPEKSLLPVAAGGKTEIRYFLPRFSFAPLKSGERLGRAELWQNGGRVESIDLICKENVLLHRSLR